MDIDMIITELDELVRMRAVTKTQRLRQQINEELATLAHGDSRTDESRAPVPQPALCSSSTGLTDKEGRAV